MMKLIVVLRAASLKMSFINKRIKQKTSTRCCQFVVRYFSETQMKWSVFPFCFGKEVHLFSFLLDVSYLCFYLSLFSDFSSVLLKEETPSQAEFMFYYCHFSLHFLKKCWQI